MLDKASLVNIAESSPLITAADSSLDHAKIKKVPRWAYIWDFEPNRTGQEITFVRKLDLGLLSILSLGYFVKNLDQTNISNAYVSGMKEALSMTANELNLIDIAWTTGYVIGQLPSQFILTRVRPSIWIPCCELVWTLLTFFLAGATNPIQVIAIRFLVGLAESSFYPAAQFLIGSWYKPSELGKRAAIFHASAAIASMFSGYLQAAVYTILNGILGKAAWQWLFIMDGAISLPVAIAGFFVIPDLPDNSRALYLNEDDRALAMNRMTEVGRAPRSSTLGLGVLGRIFTRWHVYGLTTLYVVFINTGPSSSISPLALWLKDTGWDVAEINIIPTGQSVVQFVFTIVFAMVSDCLRNRPLIMSLCTVRLIPTPPLQDVINNAKFFGFASALCLSVWTVPIWLHWAAYFISKAAVPYGPLAMSWANEICNADADERAIVLGVMNASGYAVNTWLPLLTYPVSEAPRFKRGFAFSCFAFAGQFIGTGLVAWAWNWEKRGVDGVGRGGYMGKRRARSLIGEI